MIMNLIFGSIKDFYDMLLKFYFIIISFYLLPHMKSHQWGPIAKEDCFLTIQDYKHQHLNFIFYWLIFMHLIVDVLIMLRSFKAECNVLEVVRISVVILEVSILFGLLRFSKLRFVHWVLPQILIFYIIL